jgi:hypothetical protein
MLFLLPWRENSVLVNLARAPPTAPGRNWPTVRRRGEFTAGSRSPLREVGRSLIDCEEDRTLPATAAGGPIRVMTFGTTGGTVFSTTSFLGGPCHGDPGVHSRSVTLRLRRHLVARGVVSDDDGFAGRVASVRVKVQRRVEGEWKTVRTTTTSPTASYRRRIPDKAGRYRATAPRIDVNGGADICLVAISPVRTRS